MINKTTSNGMTKTARALVLGVAVAVCSVASFHGASADVKKTVHTAVHKVVVTKVAPMVKAKAVSAVKAKTGSAVKKADTTKS